MEQVRGGMRHIPINFSGAIKPSCRRADSLLKVQIKKQNACHDLRLPVSNKLFQFALQIESEQDWCKEQQKQG